MNEKLDIKTVTAQEMKEIDQKAIKEYGIPGIVLMENAGRNVAEECVRIIESDKNIKEILIFCGSGNNGGDGLVAARHLHNKGYKVNIFLVKSPKEFKGDALINYNIVKKSNIPIINEIHQSLAYSNLLIIDALLGTGTKGAIKDVYLKAIEKINSLGQYVLSVDIPSGIDADTGEVLGISVCAKTTVTMGIAKKGLLTYNAKPYVGKLVVADIGIPKELL